MVRGKEESTKQKAVGTNCTQSVNCVNPNLYGTKKNVYALVTSKICINFKHCSDSGSSCGVSNVRLNLTK